ncbi:MAG: hypothetical protein ACK5OB_01590, partial [Pirellula sp.]
MKKLLAALTLSGATFGFLMAQPPEGGPGGFPGHGAPPGAHNGPPSPERMVEHAFEFDADHDGKLDRNE